jgi:hypothetical protein
MLASKSDAVSVGTLHLCISEAVLTALDDEEESKFNTYCSVTIDQEKQKVQAMAGTLMPVWNHNMVFKVHDPDASVLLTVWNSNR